MASGKQNGAKFDKDWKNPSFVLQKPKEVSYEDRTVPEVSDPNDVIVTVKYTGICGSDVHYWTDGQIGPFVVKSPMVLGHESSGTVHKVGSKVTDVKPGDPVAIEPGIPCRLCAACKSGKYNLCPDMAFAATPPIDGTLSRYYKVPSDFCYKLPPSVSLAEGALVEPLSVAVHIVKLADVRPGQSVVVFGAGPVGLLCLAVAKGFSAGKFVSVDINEDRISFAKDYVGAQGFKPQREEGPEDIAKRLKEESGLPGGFDVALDASGAEICMQSAVHALRPGGAYIQGGMGKPHVNWPILTMVSKELYVRGSFRYGPGDWALSVHLLASGKVSVKELISKQVSFEDAEEAFGDTKAAKGIKILIQGPDA